MFAFMERYGAEALLRDFRRPIERIVGSIGQLEEYTGAAAASRNVVFLVGCSLSGGTGGGLFLDVMRLIAHEGSTQLGGTPFVIVPLVLLPSAFDNVLAPSKRKNGVAERDPRAGRPRAAHRRPERPDGRGRAADLRVPGRLGGHRLAARS